jgi:hypothetical protein
VTAGTYVYRTEKGVQYAAPLGTDPADLSAWRSVLDPSVALDALGVET